MTTYQIRGSVISDTGDLKAIEVRFETDELTRSHHARLTEKLQSSVWFVNGYSMVAASSNPVQFSTRVDICSFHSNFIGSLLETLSAELAYLVHGLNPRAGVSNVTINAINLLPNAIPLSWCYYHGGGEFSAFHGQLVVEHDEHYSDGCSSCRMGVAQTMYAADYVNGKVLHNRGGALSIVATLGDSYVTIQEAINIGKTRDDFVHWFAETFRGALEMCHANKLTLKTPESLVILNSVDLVYE